MKRIGFILLLALLLCGCKTKEAGSETTEVTAPQTTINPLMEKLEVDPSLYTSTINEESDAVLWRSRVVTYNEIDDRTILDKKLLCSTIWKMDPKVNNNSVLLFYLDDEFRFGTEQSGIELRGKYEIIDDQTIRLYEARGGEFSNQYFDFSAGDILMTLTEDPNNIFYTQLLTCNRVSAIFGAAGSEPVSGDVVVLFNQNIIIDHFEAVTTDRLKFREGPGTDYAAMTVSYTFQNQLAFFLKGTNLHVVARTENRMKIGEDEDYWYFVGYSLLEEEKYGWVYGAYTEKYAPEKAEIYNETMMKDYESIE